MISKPKINVKPLIVGFALIMLFTWAYDFAYDRIWEGAGWGPLDSRKALIYGIGASSAIAFAVAYVTNVKSIKQFEKFFNKIENVKNESKEIPSKEKKFGVFDIVGYLSVPATIAFASGLSISYSDQPITIVSIFLSSISIGVAIAIFAFQQNQAGMIQEVIEKVNQTNKEMHEVFHGKRQHIADLILRRLVDFEKGYQHVIRVYPDYLKDDTPKKFKEITYSQIFDWTKRATNLDVKGCDDPVMYNAFNEPIPALYRDLLENAYAVSLTDEKEGIERAVENIKLLREQMLPLIKILLKYASPEQEFEAELEYYRTKKF
jgi:hypothetical protein